MRSPLMVTVIKYAASGGDSGMDDLDAKCHWQYKTHGKGLLQQSLYFPCRELLDFLPTDFLFSTA